MFEIALRKIPVITSGHVKTTMTILPMRVTKFTKIFTRLGKTIT